jgi:hypothetical protein
VTRKREADWESEAKQWEMAPTNSNSGWGVPADDLAWQASDKKLVTTLYAISRGWPNCSWPSVEGGVKVSVEVHSNMEGLVEECAACRCLYIRTDLSFQPD